MSKYGGLIPGMQNEDGSDWIDVENWLYNKGSNDVLIAAGAIYWPEFIEYRGCIIRDSAVRDRDVNFDRLISGGPVERGYVEERLNRLEITEIILASDAESLSMKQALHLGRTLARTWKAKLSMDYPEIEFHVSFIEHPEDVVADLEVTFCQAHTYQIG